MLYTQSSVQDRLPPVITCLGTQPFFELGPAGGKGGMQCLRSDVFKAAVEPPGQARPNSLLEGSSARARRRGQGIERSHVESCRIDTRRNITAPLCQGTLFVPGHCVGKDVTLAAKSNCVAGKIVIVRSLFFFFFSFLFFSFLISFFPSFVHRSLDEKQNSAVPAGIGLFVREELRLYA